MYVDKRRTSRMKVIYAGQPLSLHSDYSSYAMDNAPTHMHLDCTCMNRRP